VLLALFALLGPQTPMLLIALLVFVYGGFMGMQYTVMNTLIYTDLDVKYAAMASSMASTTQYLSMSFGIALATILMQTLLHGQGNAAYVVAFRWTVIVLAIITAVASRVFARLDRTPPAVPSSA
jgi:MFS family permease